MNRRSTTEAAEAALPPDHPQRMQLVDELYARLRKRSTRRHGRYIALLVDLDRLEEWGKGERGCKRRF